MTTHEIHISTTKPPVWDTLTELYSVSWENTAVAYGDTIHAKYKLPPEVIEHERVHLEQQGHTKQGAAFWWERYLADEVFRYEQELQAYRAEYRYIKVHAKDRNKPAREAHRLAKQLSGTMYGGIVTYSEALEAITK